MAQPNAMEILQSRAEDASQDAMRRMAELLVALRESESRLQLLQRYRDEYRAKLADATKGGVSAVQLANFRAFLGRLEEAMAQQTADVTHWQAAVERARSDWQDAEKRARSYGVLNERRTEQARGIAARTEQKQSDEYAARLAAAPRWS